MNAHRILIDYDGVILRSHVAGNVIGHRCTNFVSKVMGIPEYSKATLVNRYMYKTFGHTVSGLRAFGHNVSLKEFNKYVYSMLDYNDLGVREDDFDIKGMYKILDHFENRVHIFSSAPDDWILGTLSTTRITKNMIDRIQILHNQNDEILKPNIQCFLDAQAQFDDSHFSFIDDNILNIQACSKLEKWQGLWLTNERCKISANVSAVRNLEDAFFDATLYSRKV